MRQWTDEERLKQALLIKSWKPWEKSTGAKTSTGKTISKMNAYKHGGRSAEVREINKTITQYKCRLSTLINFTD